MSPTKIASTDKKKAKRPPNSPKKKAGKPPSAKNNKKNAFTLSVYGFLPDMGIECYLFTKNDQNDGFTNHLKNHFDGTASSDSLTEANFMSMKFRRIPQSDDQILLDDKGYWRKVIIRYSPDGISTPASRQEGLQALKQFLTDPQFSKFPPTEIHTVDCTNEEDPHALDMFFLNDDIKQIIQNEYDTEELNESFYVTYSYVASKLWSGNRYSEYAYSLGFPRT